eukprot:GGOE01014545.1.p1 GENE.GGOE01014545.1~~GGOE01014545.1.p1  ORF type:complete len:339 (+),score=66.26 GGOE01014545.1:66-1082(+)
MEVVHACCGVKDACCLVRRRWCKNVTSIPRWMWQGAREQGCVRSVVAVFLSLAVACAIGHLYTILHCSETPFGEPYDLPGALQFTPPIRPLPGRQVPASGPGGVGFLLYLPPKHLRTGPAWPVLLFLHGAAERGSALLGDADLLVQGPPKLAAQNSPLLHRFVVISPQCPIMLEWSDQDMRHQLLWLKAELGPTLNLDPLRWYISGVSFGGFGTWALGGLLNEHFAAIVPVSGGGDPQAKWVNGLASLPIWAFHGANDVVVNVRYTEGMVAAARALGNKNVRYTRYGQSPAYEKYPEMIGHNAAEAAYTTPELYDWLLHFQSRPIPEFEGPEEGPGDS